jgi:hypothetical protein
MASLVGFGLRNSVFFRFVGMKNVDRRTEARHYHDTGDSLRDVNVAIDITKDKLISLEDAAKMFPKPGGGHIHPKTVKNWIIQGYQGILLEGAQVGSKYYTTTDALRTFSRQLSERRPAPSTDEQPQKTSPQRNGAPDESSQEDDFSVASDDFNVSESDTVTGSASATIEIPCSEPTRATG